LLCTCRSQFFLLRGFKGSVAGPLLKALTYGLSVQTDHRSEVFGNILGVVEQYCERCHGTVFALFFFPVFSQLHPCRILTDCIRNTTRAQLFCQGMGLEHCRDRILTHSTAVSSRQYEQVLSSGPQIIPAAFFSCRSILFKTMHLQGLSITRRTAQLHQHSMCSALSKAGLLLCCTQVQGRQAVGRRDLWECLEGNQQADKRGGEWVCYNTVLCSLLSCAPNSATATSFARPAIAHAYCISSSLYTDHSWL
jgi:hypothetical protein